MGGATLALGAGGYAVAQYVLRPSTVGALITPVEAHQLAQSGEITLVDIRRPDEWSRFGLGEGAHPLDMRRPDFTEALSVLVDGDHSQPVALICAGGVRSKYMTARLTEAGFTHIIDIPEGMMGSRVGPGWMRRGLPLTPWNAS
ncbi:MAG: rhodanese-like domain-containing protein [Pseudomonadota bacterium]